MSALKDDDEDQRSELSCVEPEVAQDTSPAPIPSLPRSHGVRGKYTHSLPVLLSNVRMGFPILSRATTIPSGAMLLVDHIHVLN